MQIPVNFSAAQATSIASQVAAKDKSAGQSAPAAEAAQIQSSLEQSQSSSPDRDAQGQGDGLGPHARRAQDENDIAGESGSAAAVDEPDSSDPPNIIDIVC